MTKRDSALRSLITSAAAAAFRFQVDVDAIARAPLSFAAAVRKLVSQDLTDNFKRVAITID